MIAVVVGGAETVWTEVEQARKLCAEAGQAIQFYITNDMIAAFPESAIGVTLQHHKLGKWMDGRIKNGHPPLVEMWCYKPHSLVTNCAVDEGGSVGMYSARIAQVQHHHRRILLCGVPMIKTFGHFVRQRPWDACDIFKQAWKRQLPYLKPCVRSFSGWTAQQLGTPDREFVTT